MATRGLATRCTACGTVFRVVQDQLLVSDGWVRCGRCSEVFNAGEALLDLDTGKPQAADPPAPPRAAASMSVAPAWPPPAPVEADNEPSAEAPPAREARPPEADMPVVDMSASRFAFNEELAPIDPRAEPDDKPNFVRRAEQAERWRRPGVRAGLLALAVAAALGLAGQIGFEYRDLLAAGNPTLRPLLERACAGLGCSIDPPRAIDSLSVESSGLVRVEKSRVYKLSVALRNRAAIEVAVPALELSLTDSQGQLLSRRVLSATELGSKQASLAAGRELTLQATLQAGLKPEAAAVAGYTIELFYP